MKGRGGKGGFVDGGARPYVKLGLIGCIGCILYFINIV